MMEKETQYQLLCLRMRARAKYVCESLLRPLDSEGRLQVVEGQLGFHLPLMLHHLYLTVSNGAEFFEPGNWVYGIPDGWHVQYPNAPTIELYRGSGKRLDLETEQALETYPGAFVVLEDIPEGTVPIADLGGGERVWLDGLTGKLWADSEFYDEHYEYGGIAYSFWAPSVEDWLERKLAAPPFLESTSLAPPRRFLSDAIHDRGSSTRTPAAAHGTGHAFNGLTNTANQPYPRPLPQSRRGERMEQHVMQLRRMRDVVVKTLYELAATWHAVATEISETKVQMLGDEMMLQQLADAEAQIYHLEWQIEQSGYLL